MFVTAQYFNGERTLNDLTGRTIAYTNNNDLPLMKNILDCYGILPDQVNVRQIKTVKEMDDSDCVFLLFNPNNPAFHDLRTEKCSFYKYNDIKIDRVKKFIPQCEIVQADIVRFFPRVIAKKRVDTLLRFRNVIYTNTKEFNYLFDFLVQFFINNFGIINLLERFFHIHPRTLQYQEQKNKQYDVDKSTFPILEQFQDQKLLQSEEGKKLHIEPKKEVKGFLMPKENVFYCDGDVIEGTPLSIGDTINLKKQQSNEENGKYIVASINAHGAVFKKTENTYPVAIESDDKGHFCVTNPSLKYKKECLATTDPFGNAKQYIDVWDGPCKTSLQCPFFNYDPQKKDYVGKCVGGYCEMPMGYKRLGFTKYINQESS